LWKSPVGIGVQGALWLFKLDPLAPKNPNGHVILCTSTTQVHVFFDDADEFV